MQIDGAVCRFCAAGKHWKCDEDDGRCGCLTICTCEVCWPRWDPTDEELEDMKKELER